MRLSDKAQKQWGIKKTTTKYRDWRWYDADTNVPRRLARAEDGKLLLWSLEGGIDGETGIIEIEGENWYAMPRERTTNERQIL